MSPRLTNRKAQRHRGDLVGEHKIGDAGQMILACLFMAIWIADSFFFKRTTVLDQYMPLGVKIPLGIVLLILSGYLARTGLSIVFGEKRQKPGVMSEILLYLGLLMLSMSLAAAVIWVIAIGFLHYISRYEEELLLARFGEEYEQYMREVPMWMPRLRRK